MQGYALHGDSIFPDLFSDGILREMIDQDAPKKRRFHMDHALWTTLLAAVILIQILPGLPRTADLIHQIVKTIGQPAVWRGANFFGQEFADLVAYFHREVPEDAVVVLPPRGIGPDALTTTQYMQYFLYPRTIVNCSGEYAACIWAFLDEPGHAVVIAEAGQLLEPFREISADRVRMFSAEFGVIVPAMSAPGGGQPLRPYEGFEWILVDLVLGGLFLAGVWSLGGLILAAWLPDLEAVELAGFGFGLGSGVFSILLTFPLLLGGRLTAAAVWAVFITPFLIIAVVYALKNREKAGLRFTGIGPLGAEKGLLPVVLLGAVLVFLAVGLGYHRDDALGIWVTKGYGIARDGFPDGPTDWGTQTAEYPLQIPMLIAGMRTVFAERLPESKLIFPLFAFATMLSIYGYFRARTTTLLSGLFAVGVGSAPIIMEHGLIAYANLASGYFFISGVFLSLRAAENGALVRRFRFFGSLFLAFAAWSRPEVLPISVLAGAALLIGDLRNGVPARNALAGFSPLIGYALFWRKVRGAAYAQVGFTSVLLEDVIAGLGRGEFYTAEAVQVVRVFLGELLSFQAWGLAGWGVLIGTLGVVIVRFKRGVPVPLEVYLGWLYIAVILAGYALTPFLEARDHPVDWWLGGGLNRMVMPGVLLVWAGVGRGLIKRPQGVCENP
jgi:hypothetical protein